MSFTALVFSNLRQWALQDSNLRPSDYESVRGPKQHNELAALLSGALRQTATVLDTLRQSAATPDATHLRDRVPAHLQLTAWSWFA